MEQAEEVDTGDSETQCIGIWAANGKVDNIMRSRKTGMKLKRKVLDEYVIPLVTCGSEIWTLTTTQMDALAVP